MCMLNLHNRYYSPIFVYINIIIVITENIIHGSEYVDGVTCVNADSKFNCSCPPGFQGDGRARGTGCQGM